jgi:hypothetical protein
MATLRGSDIGQILRSYTPEIQALKLCAVLLIAASLAWSGEPEQRALRYLAGEVHQWSPYNKCFSCHNNGDGARALFTAARLKYSLDRTLVAETLRWLGDPTQWEKNEINPAFGDKVLSAIQFGAALTEARKSGLITSDAAVRAAASLIAAAQKNDGSWRIDAGSTTGSPATWGTALATLMARRTLEAAGPGEFVAHAERAANWLEHASPASVPDAAAILMAGPRDPALRQRCIEVFRRARTSDGGWGPQPSLPAEVFDTALAMLALPDNADARARAWLLKAQLPEGGWTETTRPSGGRSYAQHISTTAWALQALLATEPR